MLLQAYNLLKTSIHLRKTIFRFLFFYYVTQILQSIFAHFKLLRKIETSHITLTYLTVLFCFSQCFFCILLLFEILNLLLKRISKSFFFFYPKDASARKGNFHLRLCQATFSYTATDRQRKVGFYWDFFVSKLVSKI